MSETIQIIILLCILLSKATVTIYHKCVYYSHINLHEAQII